MSQALRYTKLSFSFVSQPPSRLVLEVFQFGTVTFRFPVFPVIFRFGVRETNKFKNNGGSVEGRADVP